MKLPTHIACSVISWFGASALVGFEFQGSSIVAASLASCLPELDHPGSAIGQVAKPVALWIRYRWGHRSITHSFLGWLIFSVVASPLILIGSGWSLWFAALVGYLSHLFLDTLTVQGTPLFWPSRLRAFFFGPSSMRVVTGSVRESVILGVMIAVGVGLWPLAEMGLMGSLRHALADIDSTYPQYRQWASSYEVFLKGKFQDNLSKEIIEGSFKVVDLYQQGYIILYQGELRTVGEFDFYNLHPLKVHLIQGDPIREVTNTVTLTGRKLGDLFQHIDLSHEHYIYGNLELESSIDPPYYPDRWRPLTGSSTIKLSLAQWKDLSGFADVGVRNGSVVIRHILRPGERLVVGGGLQNPKPFSGISHYQPSPIKMEFKVASISDLLIKEGDQIKEGDLIGRTSDDALIKKRALVELAKKRYEAGLIEEAEYRRLEWELAVLEKQYEVRAKISGTITKIEIKSINDFVEVVAYVRPDVVDNGVGGDHSLSSTQPFREVPSATCPAPLTSCDVASVVSVVDGDTLDLLVGGRQERVRLIGVDTPETVHPSRPVECYGPEASSFTKQLQGKQVWLTYGEDCYDKYGRLLAYLWLNMDEDPSLEMFNKELISLGYARAYTRFPFQYLNEFVGAEAGARAQERGLWGVCE